MKKLILFLLLSLPAFCQVSPQIVGNGAPSNPCINGGQQYVDQQNKVVYFCPANGQNWLLAPTVSYNSGGGGATPSTGGAASLTTSGQGVIYGTQSLPNIGGSPVTSSSTSDGLGSANQIRYIQVLIPENVKISRITIRIGTAVAATNFGAAIYSADGTTKYIDSGNMSRASTGTVSNAITPVTLNPGVYLFAYSADSTSGALAGVAWPAGVISGLIDGLNANGNFAGTAANAWSNSTGFPSSLGALTNFSNLAVSGTAFPQVMFLP